ncbi:efflux RND transporter periplasmic adaptor subunit [bacterium]|nr:efflux RND transporter periplasmic adaptor subunit [bacterium]
MIVKILFLFCMVFSNFAFANNGRDFLVSATKIKDFKSAIISIEGNANAINDTILSSEVVGVVSKINKNEGEEVRKNEIIAKIDNSKYLAIYKSSQEKLFSLESELKKSSLKLKRFNTLLDKEVVSSQEYEEVLYNHNSVLSNFNSQLEIMKFNKINLDKCNIKAKFDGIISKKFLKLGQYIDEGDNLFEIIDSNRLEIHLYIPKSYFSLININDEVEITFRDENKIYAKISNIVNKIDKAYGTFLAVVYIDNNKLIIPGEEIIAKVKIKPPEGTFLINKDAVINMSDKKIVYKIKGKKVYPVEIKIYDLYGDYFIGSGPIKRNDLIVLDGNETLAPNQTVSISNIIK